MVSTIWRHVRPNNINIGETHRAESAKHLKRNLQWCTCTSLSAAGTQLQAVQHRNKRGTSHGTERRETAPRRLLLHTLVRGDGKRRVATKKWGRKSRRHGVTMFEIKVMLVTFCSKVVKRRPITKNKHPSLH